MDFQTLSDIVSGKIANSNEITENKEGNFTLFIQEKKDESLILGVFFNEENE